MVWKTIPGFSKYEVSNTGLLRSKNYKNTGQKKVLKPAVTDDGYLRTMILNDEGVYKSWRIHKWVTLAFLGEREKGLEVNHKDGNKQNNHIENLEYCTRSENIKHAYRLGLEKPLRGEQNASAKLTEVQVREIRAYAKRHGKLKNRKQLSIKYGVTENHLKDIVSQRRGVWSHI